jgi:preprotein translocase subunit Sec61beta
MARKDKTFMPQSTAGLIRYFDQSSDSIKFKPEHVLAICIGLVGAVLALRFLIFI